MMNKVFGYLIFTLFTSITLGSYIKNYVPEEHLSISYLVFAGIILKIGFTYGLSRLVWTAVKIMLIQSVFMTAFNYVVPEYYSITKIISLVLSISVIWLGGERLKILAEQFILTPMGLWKKKYDKVYNNPRKDNGGIQLSIEEIDNLGNNGRDFEDYIAKLYRACGYTAKTTMDLKDENNLPESIMKRSGNGEQGADVLVFFDEPTNIYGDFYDGLIIQCKHYKNKVENKAVQEVVGAVKMYEKHFMKKLQPMVVTNNYLTGPAKDLAKANGVSIIDRDSLPGLVETAYDTIHNIKEQLVA